MFNNAVWWFGRVENNRDPDKAGKVQVRIFGVHNKLSDSELPWIPVLMAPIYGGTSEATCPPPALQKNANVLGLAIDGPMMQQNLVYGICTNKAVVDAMAQNGYGMNLAGYAGGNVGSGSSGGFAQVTSRDLSADADTEIDKLAEEMGVEPEMLRAIIQVETSAAPLGPDGRPTIRFEAHVFYDELRKKYSDAEIAKIMADYNSSNFNGQSLINTASGKERYKLNSISNAQSERWDLYEYAKSICEECAIKSTSFGLGQVMGFNYAAAGYSTPQEYEAAQYNEVSQVRSMANFISGIKLTPAIQQHDFMTIAKKYNGDPSYAAKLEAAYNKIKS